MRDGTLLRPGHNCWRIEPAARAAILIDGAAYFSAFRAAVESARHSIFILGWDINSRLRLCPDGQSGRFPDRLGDFLNTVVAEHPTLHAYVLTWDFALIYQMEREWLPAYRFGWKTHKRLHFHLDGHHPMGGSHHQKVVVIDDAVAFSGGFDLSKWRWDTPEHLPSDPRRVDADGLNYPPFHDVQMVVDGSVAAALGELVRERWLRATGTQAQPPVKPPRLDPWPREVVPTFVDVRVAIARTLPRFEDQPGVHEVQQLFLDMIATARRHIYIENQFLTSRTLGEALARRLGDKEGPEVVLVLPLRTSGWLEQHTMDVLRLRLLRRLRQQDVHNRLRIYYAGHDGMTNRWINIHGKVMVIDDRMLRIGSANLSNRSMGLDSECDLVIEADHPTVVARVAHVRNTLLAEHLGVEVTQVADALEREGSLIAAIESLRGYGRTLNPLEPESSGIEEYLPDERLIDPERPIDPDELTDEFVPPDQRSPVRRRLAALAALLLVLVGLAAAWQFTPLNEWLDIDRLVQATGYLRDSPLAPLLVMGGFVIGGLLVVPVSVLIVVTVIVFGLWEGVIYSLLGTVASALTTYAIGSRLGRAGMHLAGERINRISQRLARRGLLTIVAVRIIPVAPFSIINVVAGASHVRFRDYLLGTVIGMTPGLIAIAIIVTRVQSAISRPEPENIALMVVAAAAVITTLLLVRGWLARRRNGRMEA